MNQAVAIKINKRTGESWRLDRAKNYWQPISEVPTWENTKPITSDSKQGKEAKPWEEFQSRNSLTN